MKLNRILFAAAALAVASCTLPREEISVELGEPTAVELNVEIPVAGTRATTATTGTDSENGGLSNVDWGVYDLRYTIEIYDATGNALAFSHVDYDTDGYNGYSNSISLTKGRTYQLYIWADFVKTQGQDLHYNTSDLRSISLKNYTVNDESRDAYVYYGTFAVGSGANAINATLKRPFAKLRLVTTDANRLSFNQKIGSIKVSYVSDTKVPSSFAPATNTLGNEISVTDVTAPVTAYANEAAGSNCTLLTDYIFAPATGQGSVEVALSVYDTTDALIYTIPTKLIPYSRNQRTTVEGDALTGSAELTVTVDGDITEITGGNMSF